MSIVPSCKSSEITGVLFEYSVTERPREYKLQTISGNTVRANDVDAPILKS